MDLYLLTPNPTSPSRKLFFSPFQPNLLRFQSIRPPLISLRRRSKRSLSLKSVVEPSALGSRMELRGPQKIVDALSPPARLGSCTILTVAAMAAGFGLGFRFGNGRDAGFRVAAVFGAAAGATVYTLNSSVPEVAVVNLHNLVTGYDDPTAFNKEEVEGIIERLGINRQDEAFKKELCDLYDRFVSAVIPPGAENLKGSEVETILKFKDALGIDDPDAGSVHLEIGQRINRQRLETGDHETVVEQLQAFQKLVYVSTLVFGEASKFLLPWKCVLNVTDAQVDIAIRVNAQRLFAVKLNSVGRGIDAERAPLSSTGAGEDFKSTI